MGDGKTEKLPEYITEDDIGKYSSVIYPEEHMVILSYPHQDPVHPYRDLDHSLVNQKRI